MANEIEKLKVELLDPELVALADKIVSVIEEKKQTWTPCGHGYECRCHDAYQTHGYRNPNKY